jgi:hypothetical protein
MPSVKEKEKKHFFEMRKSYCVEWAGGDGLRGPRTNDRLAPAESTRAISPRVAHRPDVSLSTYPARATP